MKRVSAGLAICLGAVGFTGVAAASAADASTTTQTYTKSQVNTWNNVFIGGEVCSQFLPKVVANACAAGGSGNFKTAISYAAMNNCQLELRSTINPDSIYSFDKASYEYEAVNCG